MTWPPQRRSLSLLAGALLAYLLLERLALVFGRPDLVHDLDPGELRHLDLALSGLPGDGSLISRLHTWLAGPETIHHGGFPVLSGLYVAISSFLGGSLAQLRLIPIFAAVAAAAMTAAWLHRRAGTLAALMSLALFAGAPPLLLKWTCTARGGHLEAILFPPLIALLLDRALRREGAQAWALAGIASGFAVYFTYLSVPTVGILGLAALLESGRGRDLPKRIGALALGGIVGFSPWLFGLVVLDLPYFDATIHASANPTEAVEVHSRTTWGTLQAGAAALPNNLWPWTILDAEAAAYAAAEPDILDYRPTMLEWAVRATIAVAVALGLWAAWTAKSPLLFAFVMLPILHHLFVLRTANQPGYPLIPHRYFVLAFPATVAGASLGTTARLKGLGRRLGHGLAWLLALVALHGLILHLSWISPPDPEASSGYRADLYRQANLGQVRLSDGAALSELLQAAPQQYEQEWGRGIGLIYPAMADYYLLFRQNPEERPYPGSLFGQEDPLGGDSEQRKVLVEAAARATLVRAAGDSGQAKEWLCSWEPNADFKPIVRQVRRELGDRYSCPGDQEPAVPKDQAAPADPESP
ncbi:MAG TPA: hypothetical protein DIU15_18840 [Deltaproteobacteria bacterium]|nr:hypothetical protein [Deltaproteobacteria bacterium]HCP48103.1 hypothetical protein [Deltaproteobacteria bacterium]